MSVFIVRLSTPIARWPSLRNVDFIVSDERGVDAELYYIA